MWHYVQSETVLWTAGYGEGKTWTPDSDHNSRESAADRVAYLNGQGAADAELLAWARRAYKFLNTQGNAVSGLLGDAPDRVKYR